MKSVQYRQCVITRIGPGYDDNGRPMPGNDGYNLYVFSSDYMDQWAGYESFHKGEITKAYSRVSINDPEVNPFCYLYFVSPDGRKFTFISIKNRNEQEREEAYEAGVDCRNVRIQEILTGKPERAPYRFIGSPVFGYHKKPVAFFYSQAAPVPLLAPLNAEDVPDGEITDEAISNFLRIGNNAEFVRKCMAWLMTEFDKPAYERTGLLINKNEEEARVLIGAILSCLPVDAAVQISFGTSVSFTGSVRGTYAVRKDSLEIVAVPDLNEPTQGSVPKFMIACTESTRKCEGYMTAEELMSQTSPVFGNELLKSKYLRCIGADNDNIHNFLDYTQYMKDIVMGTELIDIFDACELLATLNPSWTYEQLTNALGVLVPHLTKSPLADMLVRYLVQDGMYVARYADADAAHAFQLLKFLEQLCDVVGVPLNDLDDVVIAYLAGMLSEPGEAEKTCRYLKAIDEMNIGRRAIARMKSNGIYKYAAVTKKWDGKYAFLIMELIGKNLFATENGSIVRCLVNTAINDSNLIEKLLEIAGDDGSALNCLFAQGSKQTSWWSKLVSVGLPVKDLVSKVKKAVLPGEDQIIFDIAKFKISRITDVDKQIDDLKEILSIIPDSRKGELFEKLDEMVPVHPKSGKVARLLIGEATKRGVKMFRAPMNVCFDRILDGDDNLRKMWDAYKYVLKDICKHADVSELSPTNSLGSKILDALSENESAEAVPLALVFCQSMGNNSGALEEYAKKVVVSAVKKGCPAAFVNAVALKMWLDDKEQYPKSAADILAEVTKSSITDLYKDMRRCYDDYDLGKCAKAALNYARKKYGAETYGCVSKQIDESRKRYQEKHPGIGPAVAAIKNFFGSLIAGNSKKK